MKATAWILGLLLGACGGSTAPAESPDAEQAAPSVTETASDDGETPADAAAAAPSNAASSEDVRAVLQLVIDDPELTAYLHLEQPDRFPLRVAGELPAGMELIKATKPVEIVADTDSKKKPVLVFTDIEVNDSRATVRYRYDIEGVRGSASLEKRDGAWVLTKSRITER